MRVKCGRRGGNKYVTTVGQLKVLSYLADVTLTEVQQLLKDRLATAVALSSDGELTIAGKVHREVYEVLTCDKAMYSCEKGGLVEGREWMVGKECVIVETQKGIK